MCAPAEMRRTQLSCHAERPVLTFVSFNGVSPQVIGGGHAAAAGGLKLQNPQHRPAAADHIDV